MKGLWTNVAFDRDGDPVEWCGHQHKTCDEANLCLWVPETKNCQVFLECDFNPLLAKPCVHELHPVSCIRCRTVVCGHGYTDCARCERLKSGDFGDLFNDSSTT